MLPVCLSVSLHEWVYSVVTQIQLLYSVACDCISQSSQQPWSGADAGTKGASDGNPEPSKIPYLSGLERALHASATATNSTFSIFKDSHQLGLEIALHALTPATNSTFSTFKDSHQLGLEIALYALTPATNSTFSIFKDSHQLGLEIALQALTPATDSTFSIFKDSHQLGLEIALHALTPATNSTFPMFTPPVPLLLFVYLVFTCMPGESYYRWLRSLLCLCDSFWALINSLICWLHKQSNSAISITTAPFLIFWFLFQCKLMCFMNR